MTAQRYLDLHDVGGADDYFSSDLADDEMRKRFSAFGARGVGCLVAYSGADEYAPKSVDKPKLVEKIAAPARRATRRASPASSSPARRTTAPAPRRRSSRPASRF